MLPRWLKRRYPVEIAKYILINHWSIIRTMLQPKKADGGAYKSAGSADQAALRALQTAHELYNRVKKISRRSMDLVVEVGPGDSIAMLLLWIGFGARTVWAVEAFGDPRDLRHEKAIVESLLRRVSPEEAERIRAVVDLSAPELAVDPRRVLYIDNTRVEKLDRVLRPESANAIISNATLEHVSGLKRALQVMHTRLAPGGVMVHRVDLRNHGILARFGDEAFQRPPNWIWWLMGSGVGFPNRHRIDYYEQVLQACGLTLEIEPTRKSAQGGKEQARPCSREQCNGFWLTAYKESAQTEAQPHPNRSRTRATNLSGYSILSPVSFFHVLCQFGAAFG